MANRSCAVFDDYCLHRVGYVTRVMKLGTLGVPPYRTFSLEELEEATNCFDTSTFMSEGSHGQVHFSCMNNLFSFL